MKFDGAYRRLAHQSLERDECIRMAPDAPVHAMENGAWVQVDVWIDKDRLANPCNIEAAAYNKFSIEIADQEVAVLYDYAYAEPFYEHMKDDTDEQMILYGWKDGQPETLAVYN